MLKFLPLIFLVCLAAQANEHIWIEAESADSQKIQRNGWYDSTKREMLSGKAWLGHFGNSPGTANYSFEVPADGSYALWLRANPVGTKMKYRINGGTWLNVDFTQQLEVVNVASDGKPDLRFVTWVPGGLHKLSAGDHRFEVEFHSDNHFHGALDCFCFTTDQEFKPYRFDKPGEQVAWTVPEITDENLGEWMLFTEPTNDELSWENIRWHSVLSEAAEEARELNRPILLWTMNGHPCGET